MADELVDFYKPLVKIDEVAYKYIIAMTEKIRPNMFPNIRNDFYKIESVIESLIPSNMIYSNVILLLVIL